jgi:hypothetical protein
MLMPTRWLKSERRDHLFQAYPRVILMDDAFLVLPCGSRLRVDVRGKNVYS